MFRLIFKSLSGWAAVSLLIFALFWAWFSATSWGLISALGLISLSGLAYAFHLRSRKLNFWKLTGLVSLAVGVGVSVWLWLLIPTGQSPATSPVSQHFTHGEGFPRYHYANFVPEIEQMNLGLALIPKLDRLMTSAKARRLKDFTLAYYREMENDPNFRALGSSMGGAYADILGLSYPEGHYYLYVPKNAASKPLPSILFLHGSAGNFKVYTWIWAKLAEELGCVIIAPSYGFGNWDSHGVGLALDALQDVQKSVKLDPAQVVIAGLSNGGLGVMQLTETHPQLFAGVILISPVLIDRIINSPAYHQGMSTRPFLFLTGTDDERIPHAYVKEHTDSLSQFGLETRLVSYPGEDHFLFFSQHEAVLREISGWLQKLPADKSFRPSP